MAWKAIGAMNNRFIGLSSEAKPTGLANGATALEYDTLTLYITPDGTNWTIKELPNTPVAVTTIDLNQIAGSYDLFTATAQSCFIGFVCIVIPRDLTGEAALTSISIQSTDVAPVVFISAAEGDVLNLTEGVHLCYRGTDVIGNTKKIQLTISGGPTAAECICSVYVSYRPSVAGGYLLVA